MNSLFRYCLAALLSALLLNSAEQHGQVKFSGLGVPGVTVIATQGDKTQTVITDQQGTYTFADLPDGTWAFQVEMLCFEPIKQDVSLTAGLPAPDWELKLLPLDQIQAAAGPVAAPKPAAVQMTTNQSAPAPAATQAKNVKPKKGAPAPPPQTGFKQTDVNASAAPAAAPPPPSDSPASQNAADLSQRASDGLLISGSQSNAASSQFSLNPAFGNNRRGARSLYTGNISFISNNSALDAKPFSLTGQDTPKSAQNLLQGGFSIQGPIKIPHLLRNGPIFVVNYQWLRNRAATTTPYLVPTQAERGGDFSQTLNALGQPVQIFDPTNGQPFNGNMIPSTRISQQALALLNFYPMPNFAGGSRYNYQTSLITITSQNSMQSRLVKGIGNKDQVFGNFDFRDTNSQNTNLFGFVDQTRQLGMTTTANWRHTFPNRVILHFSDTFSRFSTTTSPYFADKENVSGDAGIMGNNQQALNWGPPALAFGSSTIAGLSDANAAANHNQTNKVSFDGLWYRSPHSFTWGADVSRLEFNSISQSNPRGAFAFTGTTTQQIVNGVPVANTGFDFADFLLGVPDTSSLAFGNADKYFRSNSYDVYVNDDWRISPGLTINWGLRWEYNSPITELFGRLVNLAIGPEFSTASQVVAGNSGNSLIHPDLHEFQPRLAFSWRPFPASSMVVRGGYGVYYNTSVYQTIATNMAQQPPLSKSFSVQNSPADPLTLANGFNAPPTATPNTFAIDPNFRVGYAQNWQLSVQRDLPKGLLMTATYLGIKGTRAVQEFLPNTYPIGGVNPCPAACPVGFLYMTSNGNSTRESGEFQLRRRLHAGFTASADYTYSKSIDDGALGGRGTGNPVIAQNWLNLSGERGLSPFDQRHVVSANAQYTTGMGLGGGTLLDGWKGALYKEWTFLTQINAGTGLPLTPTLGQAIPGTGFTSILRPNFTGQPLYESGPSVFLNSAAFTTPAAGQWGNAGRDTITGPVQFTLNASVSRTFRLTDRFNMDLRVDANNAINHVTYQNYNTVVSSPLFGSPVSANQMRVIQTTLRLRF